VWSSLLLFLPGPILSSRLKALLFSFSSDLLYGRCFFCSYFLLSVFCFLSLFFIVPPLRLFFFFLSNLPPHFWFEDLSLGSVVVS